MGQPQLHVVISSPDRVVFDGTATSVVFPGAQGTFEVLPLHRPLVSRLLTGVIVLDGRPLPIQRGIARVADDVVTAAVELPEGIR